MSKYSPQTPGKGGSQNAESDPPSADLNHDQTSEVGQICLRWCMSYFTLCLCKLVSLGCVLCCAPVFQGFICPQCMKSHNSAEELFKHYELFHDTGDLPAHVAPTRWVVTELKIKLMSVICDVSLPVFYIANGFLLPWREDLSMLRQEVQDLHASLKVKNEILKQAPAVQSTLYALSHRSLFKYFNVCICFHLVRRNAGSLESSRKSWTKSKDNWSK